jgi:hypothetical protein
MGISKRERITVLCTGAVVTHIPFLFAVSLVTTPKLLPSRLVVVVDGGGDCGGGDCGDGGACQSPPLSQEKKRGLRRASSQSRCIHGESARQGRCSSRRATRGPGCCGRSTRRGRYPGW